MSNFQKLLLVSDEFLLKPVIGITTVKNVPPYHSCLVFQSVTTLSQFNYCFN